MSRILRVMKDLVLYCNERADHRVQLNGQLPKDESEVEGQRSAYVMAYCGDKAFFRVNFYPADDDGEEQKAEEPVYLSISDMVGVGHNKSAIKEWVNQQGMDMTEDGQLDLSCVAQIAAILEDWLTTTTVILPGNETLTGRVRLEADLLLDRELEKNTQRVTVNLMPAIAEGDAAFSEPVFFKNMPVLHGRQAHKILAMGVPLDSSEGKGRTIQWIHVKSAATSVWYVPQSAFNPDELAFMKRHPYLHASTLNGENWTWPEVMARGTLLTKLRQHATEQANRLARSDDVSRKRPILSFIYQEKTASPAAPAVAEPPPKKKQKKMVSS